MNRGMRISAYLTAAMLVAGSSIVSAHSQTSGPNQTTGAAFGSIVGGIIGGSIGGSVASRVISGVAGATLGGIIGGSIGSYLDEQDRQQLAAMTRSTANTGKSRRYRNRKTGVNVTTRLTGAADACRTVEQEVVLANGTKRVDTVQACRTAQGWKFG